MSDAQSDRLVLAVPSKGRLMDDTLGLFAKAGLTIRKVGNERGYRGEVAEVPAIEVAFISASEIAHAIRDGKVHLGVTGEDLLRETIPDMEAKAQILAPLGFGHADVIVAVPNFWIDVVSMADLEEAAVLYRRRHGTRMRVATKYMGLTRRFFAGHRFDAAVKTGAAVTMYRIVESLGATEGAPAAGTAELIVDITSTGSTLKANGLRILADGIILKSQANLVLSRTTSWSPQQSGLRDDIVRALGA